MIQAGSKVSIEYTLTLEDGTVADSNVGKPPLEYEHGAGNIISGLESGLAGLKTGDTKKVEVPPAEGYGDINPKAFQEVPKEKIPESAQAVGSVLQVETEDGQAVALRIHEIKDSTIIVDFNHPLAGKDLTFDVKVLSVQ